MTLVFVYFTLFKDLLYFIIGHRSIETNLTFAFVELSCGRVIPFRSQRGQPGATWHESPPGASLTCWQVLDIKIFQGSGGEVTSSHLQGIPAINFKVDWVSRLSPQAGSSLGKEWRWLSIQEGLLPTAPAGSPPPKYGEGAQPLHANLPPHSHFHPVFPDSSLSQPLGPLTFATCPRQASCPDPTQVISAPLQAPGLGAPWKACCFPRGP